MNICFSKYPIVSCTIGKSFLFTTIANCALDHRFNVCLSAPTGKLSSTYEHQLPICRRNADHRNFFNGVGKAAHPNIINWSLYDIHVLLVDEVINYKWCFCTSLLLIHIALTQNLSKAKLITCAFLIICS